MIHRAVALLSFIFFITCRSLLCYNENYSFLVYLPPRLAEVGRAAVWCPCAAVEEEGQEQDDGEEDNDQDLSDRFMTIPQDHHDMQRNEIKSTVLQGPSDAGILVKNDDTTDGASSSSSTASTSENIIDISSIDNNHSSRDEQDCYCDGYHHGECVGESQQQHQNENLSEDYDDYYYDGGISSMLDVSSMWDLLNCDEIFLEERPVHSENAWKHAIELYNSIMPHLALQSSTDGFKVKIEAKHAPGKGRGIFAAQYIKKGQLIWTTIRTARFENGKDYRDFIFKLEHPFACDVLQWAYVQDLSDSVDDTTRNLKISVDLDEGSYCNDGGYNQDENVGCNDKLGAALVGGCKNNYFALHDIGIGEELLCSYGDFAVAEGWKEFGL